MDTPQTTRTSLRDFLNVVFKRKSQILLFFFAVVLTVAIGTYVAKPTYEAQSQVLVKIGRENLYVPYTSSGSPVINLDRQEQINSEIEILTSQSLAEEVVKDMGPTTIYKDLNKKGWKIFDLIRKELEAAQSPVEMAVLKVQKDLEVEGIKKSNVIAIRFRHTDSQTAAQVVNTFVSHYLDRHVDVHKAPNSYKFFREQSGLLKDKLTNSELNLDNFKKQHNITSLEEQRTLLLRKEADLRAELNSTLSQFAETEHRIRQLNQQLAVTPKTIPQGEETEHSPYVINTLQARLVELELKEKEFLTKYTEQSRLVRNVREEIGIVRTKLNEQEAKRYDRIRSGINVTYQRLQEELFRNQAELKALNAKRTMQRAQLADYQKELDKLSRIEVQLNQIKQQVEVDRENYRLYLTKFEESRISDAMDTEKISNVTQIQAASPPIKPVSPKVFLNLVLGIFLGAFGGLGLAFFMEYLDDSLETPEAAENALHVPVLASVPELKK
jgi:uncharacterized protein involved in exopolysaccharide biosynthesis